ncbi:fungal-specific transcription factor domain-containing protein [Rhodocollybia butyracea]|uniref:Fungal-specific transcription factor domain-containing protein n=1 Tax=Rhodocollybia butyracea TaxID=206335 RepID=A0A9P5Q0I6_9AGAR|nr:fungal-specific transcription factor domain-containing protein [Rhodocollybia butyracea]
MKGCAAICPDGRLTTGKGNRRVFCFLASVSVELRGKRTELIDRVKTLEEALAKSYKLVSPEPHPLLSADLLQVKLEPDLSEVSSFDANKSDEKKLETAEEALTESWGSLVFYGRSATSWVSNENHDLGEGSEKPPTFEQPIPSTDLSWLAYSFPFASPSSDDAETICQTLVGYLPDATTTRRQSQKYYQFGPFFWHNPIPEGEFRTLIFDPFYKSESKTSRNTLCKDLFVGSHRLAVLFFVLALGALLDLEKQPHSAEARWYHSLGRAALALAPVLDSPSCFTIQSLVLMSHYMLLDDDVHEARWPIMGLATKLSQNVGLHIDGTHWNLTQEETHRRRCLFWEVFCYDMLQSLTYGRPPHMLLSYINTKKPFETTTNADSELEMSYTAWKHKFFGECLASIWDRAFGAHALSYAVIKRLDEQVRAYYVPPSLRMPGLGGTKLDSDIHNPPTPALTLARHFLIALKALVSFYLQRGFFATALNEKPDNPSEHPKYGDSVQRVYDTACICVGMVRSLHRHHPSMMVRFPYVFDQILSCVYVLGAIASRSAMLQASSALINLEYAYELFRSSYHRPEREKILAEIGKIRDQACLAQSDTYELPASKPYHHGSNIAISIPSSSTNNHDTLDQVLASRSYIFPVQPQQPLLSSGFADPFFEHPDMAYNPMSGYQYQDYQDPSMYFEQQTPQELILEGSSDVAMFTMLDETWQSFLDQMRL